MSNSLNKKRALVFGASSGIGQALAVALNRSGTDVVFTYRNSLEGAERTTALMEGQGRHWYLHASLESSESVSGTVREAERLMSGLDFAILVAAKFHMEPMGSTTNATVQEMAAQNVVAPFVFAREAAEILSKNSDGGVILFIGSSQGKRPLAGTALYAATKGMLPSLAKSICLEYGSKSVRSWVLSPGVTMAAGNIKTFKNPDRRREVEELIPSKRILDPFALADIAVGLLGERSGCLTGTEILVDGGLLCAGPQI